MGYLRARRSIRLGPGVKVNLNKRSVGLTVGGRGAHYSVNTRGQRTTTVGLPGTGLSYIDRSHVSASARTQRSAATAVPAPASSAAAHPGLLARHYERAYYKGVQELDAGREQEALTAFRDADTSDDKHRSSSPALMAGLLSFQLGDTDTAIAYLERVVNSSQALPDKLLQKYPVGGVVMGVGERITLPIHAGSFAAAVVLSECYRTSGRVQEAIGLLQQLHEHAPSEVTLLLLCAMYRYADEADEIVHATAGISNEDDMTLMLRLLQAEAMEKQDLPDAALEAYRDALKSKKRDPGLLKDARYGRAQLYLRMGKRAMAKRDLGRLYGDDPDYKDVADLLKTLP